MADTSSVATTTLTLNTTTAFLAGVGLVQALAALRPLRPVAPNAPTPEYARANALGACVCLVAFLHYAWMRNATDDERIDLRYGDWVVTTPLLVSELQVLTGGAAPQWDTIAAVVGMVGLGYVAARTGGWRRGATFALATLALVYVAGVTVRDARRHRAAVFAFFGLWALYPLAFLVVDAKLRNSAYDVLDLASKGLFGLYVALAA